MALAKLFPKFWIGNGVPIMAAYTPFFKTLSTNTFFAVLPKHEIGVCTGHMKMSSAFDHSIHLILFSLKAARKHPHFEW